MTVRASRIPIATLAGLSLAVTACLWSNEQPPWTYAPNMRTAVPYETFSSNPVFGDGKTVRRPPPGSIARGHLPLPLGPGFEAAERAGRELVPTIEATPANLARGARLYLTFCAVCHGKTGLGDGPMIPAIAPPPAYTSVPVRDHPAGRLMHVVTWGTGRMPGYRGQMTQEDRWRVVLHVQTLQRLGEARP